MKALKLSVFLVSVSLIVLSSCKRGEDDPFLPFSTRDARITNEWKLTSSQGITTQVNAYNKTKKDEFLFDGTTMSEYHIDYFDNVSEDSYPYSDSLSIKKDGTYEQKIKNDEGTFTKTSRWVWYDSNKDKIGIMFEDGKMYFIKKLAKDEMVMYYKISSVETDADGNTISSSTTEYLSYSPF
jgi:hypothetical protein